MTMPFGSAEEPDDELTALPTQPVHVVSSGLKPGKSIAPEFGHWRTILVSNAVGATSVTPGAQRLCNRSLRRHRLHLIVNPSVVGQPVIDGIIIGTSGFINSGLPMNPMLGPIGGGFLQIGDNVRWECQQELWVAYPSTNTDAVFVTICDEVYASDPEEWKEDN